MSVPRQNRSREEAAPTIGVLIDNVDDDFERVVWAALKTAARDAGAGVMNFLSGNFDPANAATCRRNAIFGLVSPESVDGLVVVSTVLSSHVGNERLGEYCRRFRPLPMVSLGFPLPSMPSVMPESQLGIGALVEHLLARHGRKRFMFIGGTANNADATERERTFREALERNGIAVDPRLVRRGDFAPAKAYAAVREALAQGLDFDAVVVANDRMAISAMEALRDARVRVPEDVSVTGFDDVPNASRLSLPLTTVRQPVLEMSRRAVELVLGMLRGERPAGDERYAMQVIVRRSCGCLSQAVQRAGEPFREPARGAAPGRDDLAAAVLADVAREDPAAAAACESGRMQALVRSFVSDIEQPVAPGTFLVGLDGALQEAGFAAGDDDGAWDELLTALHARIG